MGVRGLLVVLSGIMCACGGDGWNSVPGTPSSFAFSDVWAFSETDVWFVDGGPDVHRYDGDDWSTLETPSTGVGCGQ